ncbi:hypothetical protein MNB_SV-6-250 [hydrothermal vent metagenome]|uniref:Uncharacterized protein n=1 Tax=hydrothermal vent metagenome TaxID=652676 RepID=A0A1W1CDP8_9ZZZZ
MKIVIFLLISILSYGKIINIDGQCFEQKGNMNLVVPCPSEGKVTIEQKQLPQENTNENSSHTDDSSKCLFTIGKYSLEYKNSDAADGEGLSCDGSLEYIKSMFLGYEKSLSINKKKIGDIVVKKGFSKCNVELFYGDYISIGIMSGDRNMCNDFMADQSRAKKMI